LVRVALNIEEGERGKGKMRVASPWHCIPFERREFFQVIAYES
jgi:hypothetical protein